jgi:hypothetical protein
MPVYAVDPDPLFGSMHGLVEYSGTLRLPVNPRYTELFLTSYFERELAIRD